MLAILTLALLYFMVALAYCYETVFVFGTIGTDGRPTQKVLGQHHRVVKKY